MLTAQILGLVAFTAVASLSIRSGVVHNRQPRHRGAARRGRVSEPPPAVTFWKKNRLYAHGRLGSRVSRLPMQSMPCETQFKLFLRERQFKLQASASLMLFATSCSWLS